VKHSKNAFASLRHAFGARGKKGGSRKSSSGTCAAILRDAQLSSTDTTRQPACPLSKQFLKQKGSRIGFLSRIAITGCHLCAAKIASRCVRPRRPWRLVTPEFPLEPVNTAAPVALGQRVLGHLVSRVVSNALTACDSRRCTLLPAGCREFAHSRHFSLAFGSLNLQSSRWPR